MSKYISHSFSSESSTEPVTLAQTKAHLYIDSANTDFDAYLSTTDNLIKRVRQWIEETTNRSLIDRTVTFYVDYEEPFELPFTSRGDTVNITSASIKDDINSYEVQTANEDYEVDGRKFISYVGCQRWKIVYTVVVSVPEGLKMAVLNEIAKRFEQRGDREVSDTNLLIEPYKNLEWLV